MKAIKNIFFNNLKINLNIFDMQKQLEQGIIKADEISEKQKEELIKKYTEQIDIKNKELNYIKKEILKIRKGEEL